MQIWKKLKKEGICEFKHKWKENCPSITNEAQTRKEKRKMIKCKFESRCKQENECDFGHSMEYSITKKKAKNEGGADNDAGKSGILVIGRNDNIITAQVRSGSFLKNR